MRINRLDLIEEVGGRKGDEHVELDGPRLHTAYWYVPYTPVQILYLYIQ